MLESYISLIDHSPANMISLVRQQWLSLQLDNKESLKKVKMKI
jgi:hypothetical protein